jgi:hypothetical protein
MAFAEDIRGFAAEQILEVGTRMGTAINLTHLRMAVGY